MSSVYFFKDINFRSRESPFFSERVFFLSTGEEHAEGKSQSVVGTGVEQKLKDWDN